MTNAPAPLPRPSTVLGDDRRMRCAWSGADPEYRRYHDDEWGYPLHGDRPLFEKISLEAFQAGLSWITILKRRPAFREAFANFEIDAVAALTDDDIERLMTNTQIIRNRQKIVATRQNARITLDLVGNSPGALDDLVWSFAPAPGPRPESFADIAPVTPESTALSARLRGLGFRFVGPTTMYALMQSSGMVDDHVVGCWRAQD